MRVGFVGTGNMGRPMAANILKAGHQLTVWDLRHEATRELENLGATRANDLPALSSAVRVTLLSLPNDAIVEKVVFGDGGPGLMAGAHAGDVIFDLSTVSPATTRRLSERAAAKGVRLGVPRATVGEVVGKSSGASFILDRKLAALVEHDYQAGFFVDLARKDLGLALDLAESVGARTALVREAWKLYGEASAAGFGTLDSSGLLSLLEPSTGKE